jgi:hypothetical protein
MTDGSAAPDKATIRARAWASVTLLGAIIGFAVWFVLLACQTNTGPIGAAKLFWHLIPQPAFYWPFPALGAIIAGFGFLVVELCGQLGQARSTN